MTRAKHSTGSTRPHVSRPSAAAMDAAFTAHKDSEHVRTVHGLYVDAAIALLRVQARLDALGEGRAAGEIGALVVLVEQRAAKHIAAIGLRAREGS